jgi:hypothetical protein
MGVATKIENKVLLTSLEGKLERLSFIMSIVSFFLHRLH